MRRIAALALVLATMPGPAGAQELPKYRTTGTDRLAYDRLATEWDSESKDVRLCALARMEIYEVKPTYGKLLGAVIWCRRKEW